jgi:hypothetical protein
LTGTIFFFPAAFSAGMAAPPSSLESVVFDAELELQPIISRQATMRDRDQIFTENITINPE